MSKKTLGEEYRSIFPKVPSSNLELGLMWLKVLPSTGAGQIWTTINSLVKPNGYCIISRGKPNCTIQMFTLISQFLGEGYIWN